MCLSTILDIITTAFLLATLIVISIYTYQTYKLRQETYRLRKETTRQIEISQRPFVTVYPSMPNFDLKYKNSGLGIALNIKIMPFVNGDYTIEFSKATVLGAGEKSDWNLSRRVKNTETGETASPVAVHDTPQELKQRNIDDVFTYDIRYENIEKRQYQTLVKVSKEGIEYIDTREVTT